MKKGISLIVLVITIIVMIIIAGAIIISLSSTDIINKTNTAVDKTNDSDIKSTLSVVLAQNLYVASGSTYEPNSDAAVEDALQAAIPDGSIYTVTYTTNDGMIILKSGTQIYPEISSD